MALSDADAQLIATAIETTVEDIGSIIPDGSTVLDQVKAAGPRLLAEMQRALLDRYGTITSPLTTELRELLTTGMIAELLFLGYRRLAESEKAWPDEWRRRFDNGLAALAAGVDQVGTRQTRRRGALAGETRIFTADALGDVL